MPTLSADLTNIDFGVEVGGKGVAVVAAVDVDDVQLMYFVEVVFRQVGGKHIGCARVETAAQQCDKPGLFESILVGPLPLVLKLGRIPGFVVGCIQVVDARLEAGIHDGEVLVGQGDIDDQFRLFPLQQRCQFRHIVRVDLCGADWPAQLIGDRLALGLGAAGKHNFGKYLG